KDQALEILQIEAAEKDQAVSEMEATIQHDHQVYMEIINSKSWRLIQNFQAIRLKLIPRGGKLEHLIKMSSRAPGVLKTEGLRSFLKSGWRELNELARMRAETGIEASQEQLSLSYYISDCGECPSPAITIILLEDAQYPHVNGGRLKKWVQKQTATSLVEIAVWNKSSGAAWLYDSPEDQWDAPDLTSFLDALHTRYVCVASPDLLTQDETYLEVNLIALETESLTFTVNLRGSAEWAKKDIEQGFLPGDHTSPLLRQMVRKEYLGDDFTLDFSAVFAAGDGSSFLAGKVILHTTNNLDKDGTLAFATQINECDCTLYENKILLKSKSEAGWGSVIHDLCTVDTVLPIKPELSHIPTVIMVHPFLAVGGAEQVHLKVMQNLAGRIRFAVVTFEALDPELGTTADAFRQTTPFVYSLPDYLEPT
ncbi:MAG: hypothetical protein KAT29_05130, partial [Anaerolineales bacterium]|nr:hypothetical protein [Anaerolineales bacterium]